MTASIGLHCGIEVSLSSSDDEEISSWWKRPEGPTRQRLDTDEAVAKPTRSQEHQSWCPAHMISTPLSTSDDEQIGSWKRPEGPARQCDEAVTAQILSHVPEVYTEGFSQAPRSAKHRVLLKESAQDRADRLERHQGFLRVALTPGEDETYGFKVSKYQKAHAYYKSMERKIVAEARGMLSALTKRCGCKQIKLQGTCQNVGGNMFAISIRDKDRVALSAHSWVLLQFESSSWQAWSGQDALIGIHPMVLYCDANNGPMCYFHVTDQGNIEFDVKGHLCQTDGYLGDLLRQWEVCQLMPNPPLLTAIMCKKVGGSPEKHAQSALVQSAWLENLNESQLHAVCCCLHSKHPLHIIQGPPGTGKSKTILSLITHQVQESANSGDLILVTASTNKACQVLAEGFRQDKKMRRIPIALAGNKGRLPEGAAKLRNIFVHGMGTHLAKQIREAVDSASSRGMQVLKRAEEWMKAWTPAVFKKSRIGSQIEELRGSDPSARRQSLEHVLMLLESTDDELENELLCRAKVLFVTLSYLAKPQFRLHAVAGRRVAWAIIDEAGQAVEAQILPLLEWSPEKLLLVGDTKQLSASAVSKGGCSAGYDRSLMTRVESMLPKLMLSTQYRMRPEISRFPNTHFYNGELKDAQYDCVAETPMPALWLASGCPSQALPAYAFVNTQGKECKEGNSWANVDEASICAALACHILGGSADMLTWKDTNTKFFLDEELSSYQNSKAVSGKDVLGADHARSGKCIIITFYRGQINKLEDQVNSLPARYRPQVHTVDSFQGSEAENVIISCVRTDAKGGFLQDFRRLNVALTRAKHTLLLVGNLSCLLASEISHLRALAEDAAEHNLAICGKAVYQKLVGSQGITASASQEAPLHQRLDQELENSIGHSQRWPAKKVHLTRGPRASRCAESQFGTQGFWPSSSTTDLPHGSFKLDRQFPQSMGSVSWNPAKRICLTKRRDAVRQVEQEPKAQGSGSSSLNERLDSALECPQNAGEKQKGKGHRQRENWGKGWGSQQHEPYDQAPRSNVVEKLDASLDEFL